jgi:hypothetical protein
MNIIPDGFKYVCRLVPEIDNEGLTREYYPQNMYLNKGNKALHEYGYGAFCKFRIPQSYERETGVYLIEIGRVVKYVGECENLAQRFNLGYGQISPRNCFEGGQPTNCRINQNILKEHTKGSIINLFFFETENRFEIERKLILEYSPEWNRTIGKNKNPGKQLKISNTFKDSRSQNRASNKYNALEEYLKLSKRNTEILTYMQIEKIIREALPESAYKYKAWWANEGHAHANLWLNTGWRVDEIELKKFVRFKRV